MKLGRSARRRLSPAAATSLAYLDIALDRLEELLSTETSPEAELDNLAPLYEQIFSMIDFVEETLDEAVLPALDVDRLDLHELIVERIPGHRPTRLDVLLALS